MFSPGTGALRLARATSLALVAYSLSLGAHVLAGGEAPSATGTAVLLGVTTWACVLVTSRRVARVPLVALLGASQLLLHHAFMLASASSGCLTVTGAHAGHGMPGPMTYCTDPAAAMSAMPSMSGHATSGAAMTVAHAVAALLLGVVLARGEDALWFLAGLVWPTATAPVLLPSAARPLPVAPSPTGAASAVLLPGGVGRRGPPARLARTASPRCA